MTDEEIKEIFDAMIPEEGTGAGTDAMGDAALDAGSYAAEDAEPANGTAEETVAEPPEDARQTGGADDEMVSVETIDGIMFRRLGKKAGRVMIVALEGASAEYIRISEMTAIAAIPSGYQIVEAVLPHSDVEGGVTFLQKIYDRLKAEKVANVYLLAYDRAVPVSMMAYKDKEIKRAYFVSPDFRMPGEDDKRLDIPWRIETEILRGSRDEVVPEKEIRHFMKNSRSHLSKIDMGHAMTDDEQLAAFARWMTGSRSGRYTDNGFIIMMAVGLLVGYLAGWLLFKNSVTGLILGAVCGIVLYFVYRKT